jgi:hypothetical protein
MPTQRDTIVQPSPEDLAYWFLRLNGCLTIRNFLLHPFRGPGLRTDADVVAVRFPHRREYDMHDHELFEGSNRVDFVVAEVKTNQPCSLNGPWTDPSRTNINHLLRSMGPLPELEVGDAAHALYVAGTYDNGWLRARLFTFGAARSMELAEKYPNVPQLVWTEVATFLHRRYSEHKKQKEDHEQWDPVGQWLCEMAVVMPVDRFLALVCPPRSL